MMKSLKLELWGSETAYVSAHCRHFGCGEVSGDGLGFSLLDNLRLDKGLDQDGRDGNQVCISTLERTLATCTLMSKPDITNSLPHHHLAFADCHANYSLCGAEQPHNMSLTPRKGSLLRGYHPGKEVPFSPDRQISFP